MKENRFPVEELVALDRLIDARTRKIQTLKSDLRKDVKSLSREMSLLRQLSQEIGALRELRQLKSSSKKALLTTIKTRGAGIA